MKEYIRPEINIVLFEVKDAITTSGIFEGAVRQLKTSVNGNEGTDYGSQAISIFD